MPKLYGLSPEKAALLRNPTIEGALKFWPFPAIGEPHRDNAPLAGLHKARIMWPGATKAMVRESKAWLRENGYEVPPRVHAH